jgi:hypothetical protein
MIPFFKKHSWMEQQAFSGAAAFDKFISTL